MAIVLYTYTLSRPSGLAKGMEVWYRHNLNCRFIIPVLDASKRQRPKKKRLFKFRTPSILGVDVVAQGSIRSDAKAYSPQPVA